MESEYNISITSNNNIVGTISPQQQSENSDGSGTLGCTLSSVSIKKPKKRIVLEVLSVVYGENNQPVLFYKFIIKFFQKFYFKIIKKIKIFLTF